MDLSMEPPPFGGGKDWAMPRLIDATNSSMWPRQLRGNLLTNELACRKRVTILD
jgi:hypothetical protein